MAMPKKRVSKARKRLRRAHWKIEAPGIVGCPRCHAPRLSHRLCKNCGFYNGQKVLEIEAAAKKA